MRKSSVFIALSLLAFTSCNTNTKQSESASEKQNKMPEETAIKKAVDDAYRSIGFKQGQSPNYNGIRNHFIPQAQFLSFRGDSLDLLTLDQFISNYKSTVESTGMKSFYEEEIYGRTDQYGNIAQRISTYRSYVNTMDSVVERGVNSFQLVKTPNGWRVSSIIWDIEKPEHPIPDYYLTTKAAQ
jgi:hypothetical protein